jgi:hypothetical protein
MSTDRLTLESEGKNGSTPDRAPDGACADDVEQVRQQLAAIYYDRLQVSQVPAHLHDPIVYYLVHHKSPGHFLRACLESNVVEMIRRADPESSAALNHIILWLVRYAPAVSWSSPGAVTAWLTDAGQ